MTGHRRLICEGTMIIDANMHWLPEDLFTNKPLRDAFIACVPEAEGEHAYVTKMPGSDLEQIVIEKPRGYENLNYAENQYDSALQLKDMDEAGVDIALLRIPVWQSWLTLDLCKVVNYGLASHLERFPGRFRALAVAPPDGTPECLAEIERCLAVPGFAGVQMAAHYGSSYLDEPRFRPYLKALNELDVPVVVHHTPLPVDYASVVPYTNMRRQYGRCIDQATAVGRELFSDLFEKLPNLRLVHSMLGGGFFAYVNMLAPRSKQSKEELERFESAGGVRSYLAKNLFFDTSGALQWGKAQLECAISVFGADHILYGSSYPVRREWFVKGAEAIRELDIPAESKDLILGGNAARLFKIDA
jgi:predicted TIM-barrel fold metal-dependent hydrolase